MISDIEYKRLLDIETALLILQARTTKEKGFIGEDKSVALLKDMLNTKEPEEYSPPLEPESF